MGRGNSSTSLAPGFRFHPTDEELVWYYLKRKVCNKPFRFDPISVIDIYKSEPWDLPDKSKLKSRDLEWYFFSVLDKKYGNSSRTNRATERGYWKTTGKDRPVCHNSRTVGMKKTLVYHKGRAPRGERTNWVMHEYRLADEELSKSGVQQEAFVLCRVFQKSGSGPKNGEQYGAPFVEEEWEDDDVGYVPGQDVVADEVAVSDDAFVEVNDVDQNIEVGNASGEAPLPLNFCYGESSNYADDSIDFSENYQEPMMRRNDTQCGMEMSHGQMLPNLLEDEMVASPVKEEQTIDSINNANPVDPSYFHDETYMGMTDIPPIDDGLFLEANDLSNPIKVEPTGFDIEDYLSSFDVDEYLSFDVDELTESEIPVPDQERLNQKHVSGDDEQAVAKSKHVDVNGSNSASSSEQKPDSTEFKPDVNYPFIKKASQMLGSYPAPPAFASEFPTKDATLRLNAAQSSSSVHVTAGMMRVTDVALAGSGVDWSLSKTGGVNIIFSFSLLQGDPNSSMLTPMGNLLPGKMASRSCFLLMFFWVLLLSLSLKIGTCIYAR